MAVLDKETVAKAIDNLKIIPDENRPPIFRNLYNEQIHKDPVASAEFKKNLTENFNSLEIPDQNKVRHVYNALPENVDPILKNQKIQAAIIRAKFNNLDQGTKDKINALIKKNPDRPIDETFEIVSQSLLSPDDFGNKMAKSLAAADPVSVQTFKDRIKENFKNFVPENKILPNPTVDKVQFSENVQNTAENIAESQRLDAVQDVMIDPKRVFGAQEKAARAKLEDQGGGFVSAFFGTFTRLSQMKASLIVGANALYTKDPERSARLTNAATELWNDAAQFSWLPPKYSVGPDEAMLKMWGAKDPDGTISTIKSPERVESPLAAFMAEKDQDVAEQSKIGKAIDVGVNAIVKPLAFPYDFQKWYDKNSFTKDTLWNSAIATSGIAFDLVVDPFNLIGSPLFRIGAELKGAKIAKLALKDLKVEMPAIGAVTSQIQKLTRELTKEGNALKEFPLGAADALGTVDEFLPGLDDVIPSANSGFGAAPKSAKLPGDVAESVLKFKEMTEKKRVLTDFADKLSRIRASFESPNLTKPKADQLVKEMADAVSEFSEIYGKPPKMVTETYQVLTKNGMQTLSKRGMKMLEQLARDANSSFYDETTRLVQENELAVQAFNDPSLIDKGGITILGLKIPGTPELFELAGKVKRALPFVNRFPNVDAWGLKRINDAIREELGMSVVHDEFLTGLTEGLSDEQKARVFFISEMPDAADGYVDNTIQLNRYGTLQDIVKANRKFHDEMYAQAQEETARLMAEMEKRGYTQDQIAKVMKNGGDIAGDYVKNYQSHHYRNKRMWEQMKKELNRLRPAALERMKANRPLSVKDRSAMARKIETMSDAIKLGLSDKQHVQVDKLIDNIVKGIDLKNSLTELKKLAKMGLDPVLDFELAARMRSQSFIRAVSRKRLNIDLAREYGIRSGMDKYYETSAGYVHADSIDFEGVMIPVEVRNALQVLDKDSWRTQLAKKYGETQAGAESMKTWGMLKTLELIDGANRWFNRSVTTVWPKFAFKNGASTVAMNYMDIGPVAISPSLNNRIQFMLANANKPEVLRGITFRNRFGQTISGEAMLNALRENSVFVKFTKQIDLHRGAEVFMEDHGFLAKLEKPVEWATKPLRELNQSFEDHARALNAVANWMGGRSIAESAEHSLKYLISYGQLATGHREIISRAMPFLQFFKSNAINVLDTLIRDPKRIIIPGKVTAALLQAKFQSPPEGGRVYPGQPSMYREEDGRTTQISSTGLMSHVEDVDRFTGFVQDMWGALFSLNDEDKKYHAKSAAREVTTTLFPVIQLPFIALDTFFNEEHQRIFGPVKASETFAKYAQTIPVPLQRMIGFEFKYNKETGEAWGEYSPVANIMFSALGGGRVLSTQRMLDKNQGEFADQINNLFLPWSTTKFDYEQAAQMKAKMVEEYAKWGAKGEKDLKDQIDQIIAQKLFNAQNP